MVRTVIITRKAQSQRLRILDYWFIRTGNKKYSSELDNGFRHIFKLLSMHGEMGHQIQNSGFRFFTYKSYQIIYKVLDNEIVIHQIWDTRKNPNTRNL